uniref:Uncharacterized protein n=1 Tax=Arundo donax TaxID=35708 RepID=A0A0A9E8L7_ARUDO
MWHKTMPKTDVRSILALSVIRLRLDFMVWYE